MGLGLHVTRVLVFSVSAFFAGVAGALYMSQTTRLGAPSFNSLNSLLYLAVVVAAGAVVGLCHLRLPGRRPAHRRARLPHFGDGRGAVVPLRRGRR